MITCTWTLPKGKRFWSWAQIPYERMLTRSCYGRETADHFLYRNPASQMVSDEHLQYFKFFGKILGKVQCVSGDGFIQFVLDVTLCCLKSFWVVSWAVQGREHCWTVMASSTVKSWTEVHSKYPWTSNGYLE
ncbi:hypothetical protein KC19_VG053700 [Ceratodon purpureus]|uniref:Uncharacterized protein n=1 Tax=Ceratodon purpureus TaxID=3225 RepID=A0A8T0HM66_CERPU|nr:hypothetical protein KC19_VG053700 [Ceratodon purpureus]